MAKKRSSNKSSRRQGGSWKSASRAVGRNAKPKETPPDVSSRGPIRLNKFLANAGICSRREADTLISTGVVSVNDEIIVEMGYKVNPGDTVKVDGQTIRREPLRYVLLNKPKNFVTSMNDARGRRSVMELVMNACKERIYPVDQMERDTTGLLLFTNDIEMAKKLTKPKKGFPKLYVVTLDKKVNPAHLEEIMKGIKTEKSFMKAEKAEFAGEDRFKVGIEIHHGKNRVIKRMFEHLGYRVVKLDRTLFSSLTKKDLPRGYYRHLTENEVNYLKMIS